MLDCLREKILALAKIANSLRTLQVNVKSLFCDFLSYFVTFKISVTSEIFLKMCFFRVRIEQPVPLTGRKVTLATSLILLVDFIQSFFLGDKFSLINSEEIGKCSLWMICKFALYLLNKNNCKVIEQMIFLKWSSWTLSSY